MDIQGIYQRHKLLVVGGGLVVLFLLIRRFSQRVVPAGAAGAVPPLPDLNPPGNPTGAPDPGTPPSTIDPGTFDNNPGTGPGTMYGAPDVPTTGTSGAATSGAGVLEAGARAERGTNITESSSAAGLPPLLPASAWSVVSGRQQSMLKAQRAAAGLPPALPPSAFAQPAARQISARRDQIAAASLPATPVTAAPAQQTRADEHIDHLLPLPWQPPTVVQRAGNRYS